MLKQLLHILLASQSNVIGGKKWDFTNIRKGHGMEIKNPDIRKGHGMEIMQFRLNQGYIYTYIHARAIGTANTICLHILKMVCV